MKANEVKKLAAEALKSEYGFAPALKDIKVLDYSMNGLVVIGILVSVNGHIYTCEEYTSSEGWFVFKRDDGDPDVVDLRY